jgi:hypothetical protein
MAGRLLLVKWIFNGADVQNLLKDLNGHISALKFFTSELRA